jgi:cytochrome c biogenesis protein CcdA
MNKIKEKLSLIANFILLSIAYLLGIGLTSIFAKIFGKSFLQNKNNNKIKTSFVDFKESINLEKMF